MKLNKITMMLAAAALASCSEDLNEQFTAQAPQDSRLIELSSDFALGGVGAEDATTRSHWEQIGTTSSFQNVFMPILNDAGSANDALTDVGVTADEVGLCWLGEGDATSVVYTNYQFTHAGWLYTNEKEPDIFCDNLENGIWYSETQLVAPGTANEEPATDNLKGSGSKSTDEFVHDASTTYNKVNLNSGVYKTENKAIFGGKYIVYYPFNENFKEKGTIPAIATTKFDDTPTDFEAPALAKATFRYSDPVIIQGGDQAAGFKMHNLSTLVQLQVSTVQYGGIDSGDKIDQIVLYSKNMELLAQANLAADKIVAGAKGEALYASKVGTKTVVANFSTALTGIVYNSIKKAYITVLPTTVSDLKVLIHKTNTSGTDGKWATVNIGEKEFNPGGATGIKLTVAESDFKAEYIAVDDASLATAISEIGANEGTIEVIGDITLESHKTIAAKTTVVGDKLIVPETITLTVNGTVKSDIEVYGKTCCSTSTNLGGRLVVGNDAADPAETYKVTLFKTEDKEANADHNPAITYTKYTYSVVNDLNTIKAGNVNVNGIVSHKGDFVVEKEGKVTVDGQYGDKDHVDTKPYASLNFMGSTVVNDGTIEVLKYGIFDMTDANGNATASDGERMTNNGKFIHNVDAAVGTAVQAMNQNGEYRCKVDDQNKLSDAYHQWTACSIIEMVNTDSYKYNLGTAATIAMDSKGSAPWKHRGKYIDIEVNGPTASGKQIEFGNTGDNSNLQIGNLTVKSVLWVNLKNGAKANSLTVNGNVLGIGNTSQMIYESASYLTVTGDMTFNKAYFESKDNAINITCSNFYLQNGAKAHFGLRTNGNAKTMTVNGIISNPAYCTFEQEPASYTNLLAWITCKQLIVGGSFPGGQPKVIN